MASIQTAVSAIVCAFRSRYVTLGHVRRSRGEQGITTLEYGLIMTVGVLVFLVPAQMMGITLQDVVFGGTCEQIAANNYEPDPAAACD
jgi:Flp pilus assembly pilin Flp